MKIDISTKRTTKKNTRAKNLSSIKSSIQKNKQKKDYEDNGENKKDYSWMVSGALATSNCALYVSSNIIKINDTESIKSLYGSRGSVYSYVSAESYKEGTPFIFSHSVRTTTASRSGPMRVVFYVWVSPMGEKYIIPLELLSNAQE